MQQHVDGKHGNLPLNAVCSAFITSREAGAKRQCSATAAPPPCHSCCLSKTACCLLYVGCVTPQARIYSNSPPPQCCRFMYTAHSAEGISCLQSRGSLKPMARQHREEKKRKLKFSFSDLQQQQSPRVSQAPHNLTAGAFMLTRPAPPHTLLPSIFSHTMRLPARR